MSNKEKFVLFVYLGAMARDIAEKKTDSQRIASFAARLKEGSIPTNALAAAQDYLAYVSGKMEPFSWMTYFEKEHQ